MVLGNLFWSTQIAFEVHERCIVFCWSALVHQALAVTNIVLFQLFWTVELLVFLNIFIAVVTVIEVFVVETGAILVCSLLLLLFEYELQILNHLFLLLKLCVQFVHFSLHEFCELRVRMIREGCLWCYRRSVANFRDDNIIGVELVNFPLEGVV